MMYIINNINSINENIVLVTMCYNFTFDLSYNKCSADHRCCWDRSVSVVNLILLILLKNNILC